MVGTTKTRTALTQNCTVEDLRNIRGFYPNPSIRKTVSIYNLTNGNAAYLDPECGVVVVQPQDGEHRGLAGITIVVTLEVPNGTRVTPESVDLGPMLRYAVDNGFVETSGRFTLYTYAVKIPIGTLLDGEIYQDTLSGIRIGIGRCDWTPFLQGGWTDLSDKDGSTRGYFLRYKAVDEHRDYVYHVGQKGILKIPTVRPRQVNLEPGIYVSRPNVTGEVEVKHYRDCESCRGTEDFLVFERLAEAENYLDGFKPTTPQTKARGGAQQQQQTGGAASCLDAALRRATNRQPEQAPRRDSPNGDPNPGRGRASANGRTIWDAVSDAVDSCVRFIERGDDGSMAKRVLAILATGAVFVAGVLAWNYRFTEGKKSG